MNNYIKFTCKASKAKTPIEKTIKEFGLDFPNSSLGFLHATYAKFEDANENGIILANTVKDDINKLKQTQVNFSHKRQWNVCGTILKAWVNEETNEIEMVFTFYKSVYANQWEEALSLLKEGKLTVSFELQVLKEDIEKIDAKTQKLHHVNFDGVGLLMGEAPAYPMAFVLETAKKQLVDIENPEFIYAKKQDEEIFNKDLNSKSLKEEYIVDEKTKQKLMDAFKANIIAELGEETVKDWTDEDFLNDEKINEVRASLNENAGESQQETATTYVTETQTTVTEDYNDNSDTVKVEKQQTVTRDGEVVEQTNSTVEQTYTYAEVEAIKAEYETKLEEKDSEIKSIKTNAKKIVETRIELADFAKDMSDEDLLNEDKVKIAKLEKENSDLKAKVKTVEPEQQEVIASVKDELEQTTDLTEEEQRDIRIAKYLKSR